MASLLSLVLLAATAEAQDDWALTRPAPAVRPQATQHALSAARALALEGRHAEAAAAFQALAEKLPSSRGSLLRESAREWLAAGRPDAAIALLAPGDPLERDAYERAGRAAELAERDERAGRWAAAGAAWERLGDDVRALRAFERAGEVHGRLRLLQKLGRTLDAEALAAQLHQRSPSDPEPLLALAELRRAAGKRDEALALLARASAPSVTLHRALHALYARWGEAALAERELERLVALEPTESAHRLALADAALARGDRERARAEILRAAGREGSAARDAHAAQLLADRDLLAEALAQVALARKRAPDAYLALEANLLERAGRTSDAERAYKQLLNTADAAEARRRLAGLWRRSGALEARVAELRTRDDLDSLRMLAELYARDPRKLDETRALLRRILQAEPDDRDALRALARAERDAGDLHAALELAPRALAVEEALELARAAPRDPALPAVLAWIGTHASARVSAELGELHALRGEWMEARQAYQRALALEPAADGVRLASIELERAHGQPSAEALRELLVHGHEEAVLLRAAALLEREQARAALRSGAHQRAQRRVLLSLGEPLPTAALRSALLEGDERERAQALMQLRAQPDAALAEVLLALIARADRSLAERTAALRALPGSAPWRTLYPTLPRALRIAALAQVARDPGARDLVERERKASDPRLRAAAELALASDDALASALFSARPDLRRTAAEALFARDAWDAIARAADPAQLIPFGPGVVPSAFVEAGLCPARERVVAFSAALLPRLEDPALRVHAGGATPALLQRLDRAQLHGLLIELAARSELPRGAAEVLRAERPRLDWPERMWATRALGTHDEREVMELVRTVSRPHTHIDACAPAAN